MAKKDSNETEEEGLELKMTSMIDVVFLLLIFFIVTLKIPRKEAMIQTRLPEKEKPTPGGSNGPVPPPPTPTSEFEPIKLKLRKDPATGDVNTFVGDLRIHSSQQLASRLKMYKTLNEDKRVILDCGDRVPYKSIVNAISVVRAVQMPMAFKNLR